MRDIYIYIYIEKIENIEKSDIFDIFENIAIFSNPGLVK